MIDTCGCCEGIEQITPVTIYNRPGLDALLYRVGTHATFFETMLARLSSLSIPLSELGPLLPPGADGTPLVYPLQSLTTRDLSDPAIALLDACAIVGDVFTFYQERLANEGYLRTATLRRSVLELACLVNYTLRPGVASSVYLVFTLSNGNNTLIPAGTRAQNVPAAGQLPQSFETSVDYQAHAVWSNLLPRMSVPQYITMIPPPPPPPTLPPTAIDTNVPDGSLYLAGIATGLKPHDPVLFVFDDKTNNQVFAHVQTVTPNAAAKYTNMTFPLTFTPDVYNTNLAHIIAHYLNVQAFGFQSNDPNIQKVVADLNAIQSVPAFPQLLTASGFDPDSPILVPLGQAFLDASNLYNTAINNSSKGSGSGGQPLYSTEVALQLTSWSGGLYNDIMSSWNEIKDFPLPGSRSTGKGTGMWILSHTPRASTVAITGPGTFYSSLTQPSKVQPASRALLTRNINTAFARTGDIAPQLLTAFLPQISSTLYAAYGSAQVTPPTPLENFYALRAKAAPFGSNAPQKATTTATTTTTPISPPIDVTSTTTSYNEWPLAESPLADAPFIEIQIMPYNPTTDTLVILNFQYLQNPVATNVTQTFSIPTSNATVSLPPTGPAVITFTVNVTDTGSGSPPPLAAITITSSATPATPTLTITPASGSWNVEVDQSTTYVVTQAYDGQGNLNISLAIPPSSTNVLDLDARYDHIVPESWVVIESTSALLNPFPLKAVKVQSVETVARADYGISAKVTRLTLYDPWLLTSDIAGNSLYLSLYRGINVYAQSEVLPLADMPVTDDVAGQDVELNDIYNRLQSGNYVIVTGERTDIPNTTGVIASELMTVQSVTQDATLPGDTVHTTLHFATSLVHTYKRSTVSISGNVVAATQGETQNQILGSGDGSQSMQQFSLSKAPLTYVPAVTPTGEASTLQVRVNNILWHEVDTLDNTQPSDRVYITQTNNQDTVTITFGNGTNGARLPTGAENVTAVYRAGIGTSGNVDAGKITSLISRPLGVTGVNNPLSATGGADSETRDSARDNVPLASAALGRIVSVQDYASFARTFAGIGKASATNLSDGQQQVVYVTIAGQDNIPIDTTSSLYQNLVQSLQTFGDPGTPFILALADAKLMILSARVNIGADYLFDDVVTALRTALLDAFSFERRDLGQPVYQSEVLSVMQQVAGVVYVDLDILDAINQLQLINALQQIQADQLNAANGGSQANNPSTANLVKLLGLKNRKVVPSGLARPDSKHSGEILPAELVFLSLDVPDTLILNQLTTLHFTPA
ncbi:MAG: putative baseplate assembly protein [Ktedonobacteraceae bacterium]